MAEVLLAFLLVLHLLVWGPQAYRNLRAYWRKLRR